MESDKRVVGRAAIAPDCRSDDAKASSVVRVHHGPFSTFTCEKCGDPFERHIKPSKMNRPKHCDDCKRKVKHRQDVNDLDSILKISKRTASKILKRAKISCAICDWNEAICDIHHIISEKAGGTDQGNNLIIVCPNCHRVIHSTRKYSIQFLQNKCFLRHFPNWREYYYPKKQPTREEVRARKRCKRHIELEKQLQTKIDRVLNSGVDFSKFGWVRQVAEVLQVKPQKVNRWMKRYMPKFYNDECFKRNIR